MIPQNRGLVKYVYAHVPGGQRKGIDYGYERGARHHNAKLTEEQVREIRARHAEGRSFSDIAREFGIVIAHAFRVATRKTWRHIP